MNAGASRMRAYQRPPVSHIRARTTSGMARSIARAYDAVANATGHPSDAGGDVQAQAAQLPAPALRVPVPPGIDVVLRGRPRGARPPHGPCGRIPGIGTPSVRPRGARRSPGPAPRSGRRRARAGPRGLEVLGVATVLAGHGSGSLCARMKSATIGARPRRSRAGRAFAPRTSNECPPPSIGWTVARSPSLARTGSSTSVEAKGSRVPCRKSIGTWMPYRCSSRTRSGLPGGCSGYPRNTSPAAGIPSATAIDAIRPPNDLPLAQTGSPSTARPVAAANAARHAATATGARIGGAPPGLHVGEVEPERRHVQVVHRAREPHHERVVHARPRAVGDHDRGVGAGRARVDAGDRAALRHGDREPFLGSRHACHHAR